MGALAKFQQQLPVVSRAKNLIGPGLTVWRHAQTERTGSGDGHDALVAPDRRGGLAVEVRQAVQIVTDQYPVHGRAGIPSRQALRSGPTLSRLRWRTIRSSRRTGVRFGDRRGRLDAVVEAVGAQLEVAAPPLAGALPGNAHCFGHMSDRTAGLDARHNNSRPCGVSGALR